MGNKLFTLMFAALLPAAGAMAADYYVSVNGNGSKDGSSWGNALPFATFYSNVNSYANGDTFYFAGGTYYATSKTPTAITNGYTFIGGFATTLTGTEHTTPTYPSATPTIFSGDVNKNGEQDAADASRFLALKTNYKDVEYVKKPFVIQGIEFTNCYDATSTKTHGALQLNNCYDVTIKNCRFYNNNTNISGYGGMAFTSNSSSALVQDCEFIDNSAAQRGGAAYIFAENSNYTKSSTKGYTIFERCLFSGNKVTATSSSLGSAICYTHGPALWLVNCTITGNETPSGGAVYVNGADDSWSRNTYVIGCTIAGNTTGNQINMSQGAHLYLADSYIVGNEEDGTTAKAAIAITGATESSKFEIASKGYNIVGGYANQVENATNVPSWDTTDSQTSTNLYSTVFGTNTLSNGVIKPIVTTTGYEGSALSTAVSDAGWDATTARVDVTVDQKGTTRGSSVTAGAYAETLAPVAFKEGFTYTTFSSERALDFTNNANLKAYVASTVSDGVVSFTQVEKIHANTGVLVARTDGNTAEGSFNVAVTDETVDAPATNYLTAVTSETTVTSGYVYGKGIDGYAFYKIGSDGYTIPAGKAYLNYTGSSSAKALRMNFGETTGITTVNVNPTTNTKVYNLAGQAISKANAKGIYIINGKKYIKK